LIGAVAAVGANNPVVLIAAPPQAVSLRLFFGSNPNPPYEILSSSLIEPQAAVTMDAETQRAWDAWFDARLLPSIGVVCDEIFKCVAEDIGELRNEIGSLRAELEVLRSVVKSNGGGYAG
jgi:hypothetical protein